MNVKVKKLTEDAVIPEYAKAGDAGLDLTAVRIIKDAHSGIVYGTGLAFEIPEGYVGLTFPRSSVRKTDLRLSNSVGVIDSGYRGEIMFSFDRHEFNSENPMYHPGDRIGQILIVPYPTINLIESDELNESERGAGGHGSTGN